MRRILRMGAAVGLALAVAAPAAAAAPRDRRSPVVRFSTADDQVIVGAPIDSELTRVRGTATDRNGRGVKKISVLYCANAQRYPEGGYTCGSNGISVVSPLSSRLAEVTCTDARRRRCTWSADVPAAPGSYLVMAIATDRAGNKRVAGPIFVTIV